MNWVVLLARNNLHLTKKAVQTIRAQDIPVQLLIIDNASTDGTSEWLQTINDMVSSFSQRISVAQAWNIALTHVFDTMKEDYCLVVNNDIELRPDTYRWLIADGGGFVTAVGTRDPSKILPPYIAPDPEKKRPHPDFSCYLIRRETWERVGRFDEGYEGAFVEDQDYHIRMHQAGIHAEALELPFLHYGSMTVKNADAGERARIMAQAEKNREYFKKKWGFAGGSPEYYRAFNGEAPTDTE